MAFLEDMKFRNKLLLLLVFPLLGLLFFSLKNLQEKSTVLYDMERLKGFVNLSVMISALIHETQKERGLTAAYIGSKGEIFKGCIAAQRKDTDVRYSELNTFLQGFTGTAYGKEFVSKLNSALAWFKQIAQKREKMLVHDISFADTLDYYTDMNAAFLDVIVHMLHVSKNAQLNNQIFIYVNFLQFKDMAGIERALLSDTFFSNKFGQGMFVKFSALVAAQDTYEKVFFTFATDEQKTFYKNKLSVSALTEVNSMRNVAFEKANEGNFGVDPTYWFKIQTNKINVLKEIEDKLSSDLLITAKNLKDEAFSTLILYIAIMIIMCLVSVLLLYYIVHTIILPIKRLHEGIKKLAEGKFDIKVGTDAKDEIGELSRAFDWLAANLNNIIEKYKAMIEKYKGLMNILPTGVKVTGPGTQLVVKELNDTILKMFGYNSKEEFLQVPVENIFTSPDDLYNFCTLCNEGPIYQYEIRFKRKDGSVFWASVNSTFYTTEDGKKEFINVVDDITEKKEYEEALKQMAYFDNLTGLPNRKMLFEFLNKTLSIAKRYNYTAALLFLDLDKFKHVNDTLGHETGDLLLKASAKRIISCIRDSDTVARLGGDEFVVVLSSVVTKEDAANVAKKIIDTLCRTFNVNGYNCNIGTSIGISLYPYDGTDADTLIKKADIAMYNVKQGERNSYQFFSP
ncbi:MAG: diguanylate cyclase [Candidatus Magnetoovum sp. WYHC-5]|nr:diguanylate cyclase [Candidatus Magnetoovum sp. WYHC-5]